MNVPMQAVAPSSRQSSAAYPQTLLGALDALSEQGRAWGPELIIDEQMVSAYLELSGDDNPIHRKQPGSTRVPIIPGGLYLAVLPRLTSVTKLTALGDYRVYHVGIDVSFVRPVAVGRSVSLRFSKVEEPSLHDGGIMPLRVLYEIGAGDSRSIVVKGAVRLALKKL